MISYIGTEALKNIKFNTNLLKNLCTFYIIKFLSEINITEQRFDEKFFN